MEVYILFTDTKTQLSKMIKTYTQHPYSHVSLSFDPGLSEVYSFGRKHVDNAFDGGFVKEDMHNYLFQRAQCAVFSCSVTEQGYASMREYIVEMEKGHALYKYNLSGLFGIMMKKSFVREYAFFCSQFVTEVLSKGGIEVSDKPACLVMPRDVFAAKELKFVYSGELKTYPLLAKPNLLLEEAPLLMEVL